LLNILVHLVSVHCELLWGNCHNSTLPSDPFSKLNYQSFNSSGLFSSFSNFRNWSSAFFLQGHFVHHRQHSWSAFPSSNVYTFWLASMVATFASTDELLKSLLHLCNPSQHMWWSITWSPSILR
jgi:hypothetical protein